MHRVVWSTELLGYDFGPGHPMSSERIDLTIALAGGLGLLEQPDVEVVAAPEAPDELLETVHTREYVDAVRRAAATGRPDPARGLGTEDNPVFPLMHTAAARVVAGSAHAALAVMGGAATHAVNVGGGLHHAMPGAASGFCLYNDAAVAIRAALAAGADRVAYVDLDAHHGDGVQAVFWDDPRVLTISVHETGRHLFPGTGFPAEVGGPGARGTAVNVALPSGTGDAGWLRALDAVVPPLLEDFAPDLLVTQHGCDSHRLDPLTSLRTSVDGQRAATVMLHDLAHSAAGGRWLALGGGGYAWVEVVPRVWTHLLGIATHRPVALAQPLPQMWRDAVIQRYGAVAATTMAEGVDPTFTPWSSGYDPADDLDRAVRATRQAVFPHHGLDPDAY